MTRDVTRFEHGLAADMLIETCSTDRVHILDDMGNSVCGYVSIDFDHIVQSNRFSGKYRYKPDGTLRSSTYSIIHRDWGVSKSGWNLCSICDDMVADEIKRELFDEHPLDSAVGPIERGR